MDKKRMLADVLWEAANKYLAADAREDRAGCPGKQMYSCHAVLECLQPGGCWIEGAPEGFWNSLGCQMDGFGFDHIDGYRSRQGVRYMWLLLAMHVAEDEGIEV